MIFYDIKQCTLAQAYNIASNILQCFADIKFFNVRCQKDIAVPVPHEGIRGSRGTTPLILNLGTR